jgi:iron-regulated transporter 1
MRSVGESGLAISVARDASESVHLVGLLDSSDTDSVISNVDIDSYSSQRVSASIYRRLYASHFLSTWNSRVFEFGAVLYLSTIFPGTLLPMSAYALARSFSAIALAPLMGQYIDSGNRLQVVQSSIVLQRVAVAASCAIFYVLVADFVTGEVLRVSMLALVALLACVEKLASILNMVSVEKDWVYSCNLLR